MEKLQVPDRTEAVATAIRHGSLAEDELGWLRRDFLGFLWQAREVDKYFGAIPTRSATPRHNAHGAV
jgi:hypothetical protein